MKQVLLFLLAVCGLCLCTAAQPEILSKTNTGTDKWEMTPAKGIKKGMGRLNLNFPSGIQWSIDIYSANKFIINRSIETYPLKYYDLPPGLYNFRLNTVMVENVPVEEGKITRLKAGLLELEKGIRWELTTEEKKFLTSGNKSARMAFPVGKYQLKEEGNFRLVEIIDEFRDPVETHEPGDIHTKQYVMTPTSEKETGRLQTRFPLTGSTGFWKIVHGIKIYKEGVADAVEVCDNNVNYCASPIILAEGKYVISFYITGFGKTVYAIKVSDVLIKNGYETRLKVGYMVLRTKGIYELFDESNQYHYMTFNEQGSAPFPLPVGIYTIHQRGVGEFKLEVKDGSKTELNTMEPATSTTLKWSITPLFKADNVSTTKGRYNCAYPGSEELYSAILLPNPNSGIQNVIRLDSLNYFDVIHGEYKINVNYVIFKIPIQAGKQTKVKVGYLKVSAGGRTWDLQEVTEDVNAGPAGTDNKFRAIPVGYYKLLIKENNGAWGSYLIKIREGESLDFKAIL